MRKVEFDLLSNAIELATVYHKGQLDKAGKPYILHPLAVMLYLDDPIDMAVGVCHDVLEDTDCTFSYLRDQTSLIVAQTVLKLTKKVGQKYEDYIQDIKYDARAKRVKIADIKHNLSEERLKVLDEDEANYLRIKYNKALRILGVHVSEDNRSIV